jgi:hypothetical protein
MRDSNDLDQSKMSLAYSDRKKLLAFKRSVDSYGAIPHSLSKAEIDRFIATGFLELRGVGVGLTARGKQALSE